MVKGPPSIKIDSSSRSYDDGELDSASLMGQLARSSVRGGALSDWESAPGSAVDGRARRRILSEGETIENSTAVGDAGEDEGARKHRPTALRVIVRWWSGVASRVSRSASSLLSQHSPNLNDILDGVEDSPLEQPRRGVQQSIPEDPLPSMDGENEQEVFALREEVALLKKKIRELEEERDLQNASADVPHQVNGEVQSNYVDNVEDIPSISAIESLRPDQISRYSRQLLLNDGFGVEGQKKLLSSNILVVGAGGIGSSVLLYLATAGVGHVTVVDYDCVEMSNLHRQVIHKDADASKRRDEAGMNKAQSAKRAMLELNPTLSCTALAVMISAANALELASKHDVVVDACDNPQTRYLLNDACILAGKPLVSGSAMGTEGQLTVYNYNPKTDSDQQPKRPACYRCLYPNPNPAEGCKSCSDNGVLGMVPGAIGVLQAMEAIKVVTDIGSIMHDRLLMYDALHCSFLSVKKPPARPRCAVCSPFATIKSMEDSEQTLRKVRGPSVCAVPIPTKLSAEQNMSCIAYNKVRSSGQPHVLLDVRVPRQYEMCSLEGSINLPLEQVGAKLNEIGELSKGELPVYCLCRRGIASAEATRIIQQSMDDGEADGVHSVHNIAGGLNSWVQTVDSTFPQY